MNPIRRFLRDFDERWAWAALFFAVPFVGVFSACWLAYWMWGCL